MNFIEIQDNLLTKKECEAAIMYVGFTRPFYSDVNKSCTGYDFVNLMPRGESFERSFSPSPLVPIANAIDKLKTSHSKKYCEVNHIGRWHLDYVRLKRWKPGYHFSRWHSEQNVDEPGRILSFLIYLSDNDAYTEFRRHRNVRTKAGRGIIFPAHYTHEHRGSICKKGLDRYIISGYYTF